MSDRDRLSEGIGNFDSLFYPRIALSGGDEKLLQPVCLVGHCVAFTFGDYHRWDRVFGDISSQ